ncbi:MAG: hypothetical protein M0R18_07230 [Deltaproteobacteria bacterium]|nr:hypothetical protein [Deltaproteobacteria bacterium]
MPRMTTGMQLNLFQWDLIEIGRARESLAILDFAGARQRLQKVLNVLPGHREALRTMRDVQFWEDGVNESDKLDPEPAIRYLWERMQGFPFGDTESYVILRRTLLGRLLVMMHYRESLYIPPDLCRGFLYLQLEDHAAATTELRLLLERLPDNGRLRAYLADALWMQGKEKAAAEMYAAALLISPQSVNTAALRNPQVTGLVREHGPERAPMYGYMTGLLPLGVPSVETATPETRAYACLVAAERARLRNDYQVMIAARRDFKEQAPAVFQDYLDWLAAGEAEK